MVTLPLLRKADYEGRKEGKREKAKDKNYILPIFRTAKERTARGRPDLPATIAGIEIGVVDASSGSQW